MTRLSIPLSRPFEIANRSEVSTVRLTPGQRINPIRHEAIIDSIFAYAEKHDFIIRDEFNALGNDGARWLGLFQLSQDREIDWSILFHNANDGSGVLSVTSGICLPEVDKAVIFSEEQKVIRKYGFVTPDELQVLVNEKLEFVREHYNLEFERMEHYKNHRLTRESGHDIICRLLDQEVIAGRLAHELISTWKNPPWVYLKPRTLWSLFLLCGWFLNRLNVFVLVERTTNLHHVFDEIARFDKKPTIWTQDRFA